MKRFRSLMWLGTGSLLLITAGCAHNPVPTEQLALSKTAVNDAAAAGASQYDPMDLASARNKLASADTAISNKDYKHARRLAEQAEVDARLARAKSNEARAQKAADTVQENNRVLREELNRS